MKKKTFDCVEMKDEIQRRVLQDMAGLTREQERRRTEERILSDPILGPLWQRKQKERPTASPGAPA